MGIPSYFRQIIKDYPDTHFWKDDMSVDHFLIDFNAMIYQVILLLNEELGDTINGMSPVVYENKLLNGIILHLQHVICEVICPRKTVYIAVDGPPPRAKMIQQRSRRYKTLKEQSFKTLLEQKYKISIPSLQWNKSSISPGTSFMAKLSKLIVRNIRQKTFQVHNDDLLVIFSDYSVPGEGEHKLLPSIRKLKDTGDTSVIYSPDADLIVLGVMSGVDNIFILREPKDSEIELNLYSDHEFLYLSIDVCRREFNRDLTGKMPALESSNEDDDYYRNILQDYSFLTFLCGNDFVLPAPFLKMKEGGIQILIDIYKEIFEQLNPTDTTSLSGTTSPNKLQFLVNNEYQINTMFFTYLITKLSHIEESKLQRWQRKRDKVRKGQRSSRKAASEATKKPWEVDMGRFQHEEYYSPLNPFYERLNRVFDKINYFDKDWNMQYNRHFFGKEVSKDAIDDVCRDYINSLSFCLGYYFENPPSWSWFYKHRSAPTMKDLSLWLEENSKELGPWINVEWEESHPYTPFEQLMMILPRQSFKLLPRVLNIDKNLDEYYPKNFILDIVQGTKFIYSEPILPDISIEKIREKIDSVLFSALEIERNTIRDRPFIYKTRT
jgi:5'-3' exoribonuclease 2